MAQWKSLGGGAGLVLLLGTTAQADVTASEVWQSWKDFSATMGQTMAAESEEMSGDTLTVTNVTMTADMPDGSMEGSIDSIAFKEMGDGTVEVTPSEQMVMTITTEVPDADPVEVSLTVSNDALSILVAGTAEDRTIDYSAAALTVVLDSVSGAPDEAEVDASFGITGIVGNYAVTRGETGTIASDSTADALTFDVAVKDPVNGGDFTMTGGFEAIKSSSTMAYAADMNMEEMSAALAAGFGVDGGFTYGKSSATFDFKDATSSGNVVSSSESGGLSFTLNKDVLKYTLTSNNAEMTVAAADMPIPQANIKMAEAGFSLAFPVAITEAPQDFAFLTRIVGLAVSDEIWGMIDPTAILPHDPATAIIDVTGKAKMLVDIFAMDPEAPSDAAPGELHALTLNQLKLTVGGADLSGTGDFTFDNTDLTTVPGMPKPTGLVDLKLVGGNVLLDKLVQMGLLPEDQAMGAKMMMGMFGRVTEGAEDTLTSQIEMKADGSIFANGQQIQ